MAGTDRSRETRAKLCSDFLRQVFAIRGARVGIGDLEHHAPVLIQQFGELQARGVG